MSELELPGASRGLVFQLIDLFGSLPAQLSRSLVIDDVTRRKLRQSGLVLGLSGAFLPACLKPKAAHDLRILWVARRQKSDDLGQIDGLMSFPSQGQEPELLRAAGYQMIGKRCYRLDLIEKMAVKLAELSKGQKSFEVPPETASLIGGSVEDLAQILVALGYRAGPTAEDGRVTYLVPKQLAPKVGQPTQKKSRRPEKPIDPHSPFAKLQQLKSQ